MWIRSCRSDSNCSRARGVGRDQIAAESTLDVVQPEIGLDSRQFGLVDRLGRSIRDYGHIPASNSCCYSDYSGGEGKQWAARVSPRLVNQNSSDPEAINQGGLGSGGQMTGRSVSRTEVRW